MNRIAVAREMGAPLHHQIYLVLADGMPIVWSSRNFGPRLRQRVTGSDLAPKLAAAAYTYNKQNDKLTTNYAIDRAAGTLVTQGSVEGVQPVVSPNTGLLRSVGPLGTGPLDAAALDTADTDNTALAALRQHMEQVAYHHNNVAQYATPELEF